MEQRNVELHTDTLTQTEKHMELHTDILTQTDRHRHTHTHNGVCLVTRIGNT